MLIANRLESTYLYNLDNLIGEIRQDIRKLLPSRLWLDILPGDTGKLHGALDVSKGLAFDNSIVNILKDTSSNGTGLAGVCLEDLDDFLDSNRLVAGSPSVKVCGSADEGVIEFSLTSELGFRNDGHVDNVTAPLSVHKRLGSGREGRTFHANHSFPSVQDDVPGLLKDFFHSGSHESIKLLTEWFTEHGVYNQTFSPKEGVLSDTLGPVDDLIGDDEMTRGNILSQRTDRREGNDSFTTDVLQGGDICSARNLAGGDGVMGTVTGNESNEGAGWERGDIYRGGRLAPRSLDMDGFDKGEVVKVVETTATDTSDKDFLVIFHFAVG